MSAAQNFVESGVTPLDFQQALGSRQSRLRYVATLVVLAGFYFAAAKFGLSLASVHTNVSPVWPPTGIAIAAVLLLGYRVWPGILLGAFLSNFLTPVSLGSAMAIAVGNTLEAVCVAGALNAIGFHKSFDRARDVFKFVAVVLVCTTVSATIGNLSLTLGHSARWSDFGSLWVTWWLGDLTGAVTVTPLILTWAAGTGHWLPKRRYFEATVLILLLSASAIVTFGGKSPTPIHYYPLTRLIVPFLLWAAFRLGRRGVTVAVAVISAFAIWGTWLGFGPFISGAPNESLLMLQLFIATNAVTFLFLVTVVEERRIAEEARLHDRRRLQANLAVTRILAESPETSIAMQRILATVGETLEWEFGGVWIQSTDPKLLRSAAIWQAGSSAPQFEALCRERSFEIGIGLPGRVWETLKPAWIRDVAKDDNFPRAKSAIQEGLHAAFAFPILFNEKLLGVIEFFSSEIRQPDEQLLAMFGGIGGQIGQFIERKQAEAAVESASLLPKENPSPVIRISAEGVVTYTNPAAQSVLEAWGVSVGQAAPAAIVESTRRVLARNTRDILEIPAGNRSYSVDFAPITSANYVNLYFNDITERLRLEKSLAEFARRQSVLFEFSSRLQDASSLAEVYDAGLDAILAAVQCDRASILLCDDAQVMRFVGWRGLSESYREAVEGHSPWNSADSNPEPQSIHDVATADLSPELKATIIGEGIRAAAFIPLISSGKLIGKFMAYYDAPHEFTAEEIDLSMTLARNLANTIDRKRAADALRQNEERLRLATTTGKVGVWDWDIVRNRVSWTDSLYQIHGIEKDEFDGTVEAFSSLVHPEDREQVSAAIQQSLETGAPYHVEMRTVRPDGEVVWIYTNAAVLREGSRPVRMLGGTVDISDIKRAEAALRDSEERYRSVIEALPAAVYTTDAVGRVTMFNQAAVEFSGRVPEIGSDSWCVTWKLYHPDGRPLPHDECPMAMALKEGKANRGHEAIAERPDGTRVNFLPFPTPLRDSGGKLTGAINMLVDITDRKRAEEELRDREQRLSAFFSSAALGVAVLTPSAKFLQVNDTFCRIVGYSREELLSMDCTALTHSDDVEPMKQKLDALISDRISQFELEKRYLRKDGQEIWVQNSVSVTRDGAGHPMNLVVVCQDITARKQTEKALRHLAAIVETTDDAVISKDMNGIITSWNPAAERLYGYKAEEVIGKSVTILIPENRPDEEPAILERLRKGLRIDHYETKRVAKDGRTLHVSLTVSPIYDAAGKIVGASKIARDITQQKKTQDEIARLLAAERAARQDAEIASRTKDEFLAVLSHELRTPLTAMLGWLSILRGHRLDEKTTEHAIETIERNAKAQAQLIEDLVDISRIVGGKLNLEVSPIDLLPVIKAAIEVVRPAADAKEITIDVNYDPHVGPVSGDPSRLQQIIWNLLSNAVKFTPKGGTVRIDFRRHDSYAELIVHDSGIGISPDFLPHVFERFRQAESTATRSHRGMGLGLAIVRHLIELHGGTVWAASEGENRGASFTVHLPLAPVQRNSPVATLAAARNGAHENVLNGLRILLVEDEPDARELIAMLLQGSGASVEAVDSAGDALQRLPLFIPDLLLSDIGLPRESGYDLIRKVRSLSSDLNKVPAIALTAFATDSDRKMSLSAGFQAHLAKPVEPTDLVSTIKKLLNGKTDHLA